MKKLLFIMLLVLIPLLSSAPPIVYSDSINSITEYYAFLDKIDQLHKDYIRHFERIRLADSVAFYESRNNPLIVNSIGCAGLFQFGQAARNATGYGFITSRDFIMDPITKNRILCSPDLWPIADQYKAMDSLMTINEVKLQYEIEKYAGTMFAGVFVTKSGILCAAHLAGYSNVRKFFQKNGSHNSKDMNNTSIKDYMSKFSNFNI